MSKYCPKCNLISDNDAIQCDCGYIFKKNKLYSTPQKIKSSNFFTSKAILGIIGLAFLNIPLSLVAVGLCTIPFLIPFAIIICPVYLIYASTISTFELSANVENIIEIFSLIVNSILWGTLVYFLLQKWKE